MKQSRSFRTLCTAVLIALWLSACSGTPGTPLGSVVNAPGGGGPPPTQLAAVKLTVTLPSAHRGAHPNFLSPNTQSLTIGLISVNGLPVTGVHATTLDTVAGAPGCVSGGSGLTCTTTISGSPGNDIFAVSTYAGRKATGALLSIGSVGSHVGSGTGKVVVNSLSLSINGVIASLQLSLAPSFARRGHPKKAVVNLTAYDATGAQIIGAADYQSPVTLAVEGDGNQAFTLETPHASGQSVVIAQPTSGIALQYNGNTHATPINVAATVNTPGGFNVSAPFALRGKQPPPPVGTIYVLNLGSNDGQGATVTEYDGSASGNAAPKRTLVLDANLYARSIALDGKGDLYVGYFNSSVGVSGSNTPDAKNIVAIYSPSASGNQKPAATLVADPKTQTAIYPISMAFNSADGLVVYGSTTVDGNTGNAVLTYAPGSNGPAAPLHGFDFAPPSPYLRIYPGPNSLALDGQGNVYLGGTLSTTLQNFPGVYVASASDIGNPNAAPTRTIPWDSTTEVFNGRTIALDNAGEIYVGNEIVESSGTVCQGRTNVFAAGTSGGITDVPPLRILTFNNVVVKIPGCANSQSQAYFPAITVYGTTLFVADIFNNAISTFPSGDNGPVNPATTISGSATQLNAPIAIAISTLSNRAKARLVTGVLDTPDYTPPRTLLHPSSI